eukprot:TRINITY_DN474_c0_g1_i1.p1 TRINITY_DN474_c0_g1~~TRINITY_DN474_c0_g1_i1.p1  ORF type:complete len:948 (+),score=326.69 TRINITY_DN474_c0_g1_i1:86-2929(+)
MSQKSSQKSPKTPQQGRRAAAAMATPKSAAEKQQQKDIERFQKAFTATTLRSCSPASLGAKLVELGDIVQAVTPHMDPKQAADILKKSGFATELMRDAFLNSTVANQLVAGCLVVDLLELTVPEMIFDGHEKKLFRFMLRQFEQLERSSRTSESYKKAVYIAEKVASTRFLIVLSEADDTEEQTRELFDLCLNRLSARGMEDSALGRHLQEMMVSVLDDVQTVDDEAMALFIQPLSMEGKKRNPGGAMVVKGVMRKLSEKLVQVVSRHIMQRAEELEGDLDDASKDHKRTLSEMRNLLTVVMELGDPTEGHTGLLGYLVPHFVQKLTHQNTPLRNIVMKCFGTLFAENTSLVQTYKVAFRKFLQCFDDQGKELRAWMVGEWAGRFVRSKMPEEDVKKLVLRIVRKHCTDAEEAVRKVCVDATAIICSAVLVPEQAPQGGAALHGEARELLSTAVLHLMRDKKSAVRAHARERFMVLYNEEVQKSYNAIQAYALIPAQLIACDGLNGQQTDGCIAELLPEPGLDGDAGAQASSALTVQLVKLWVALTSTGRAQTEKWLRGKRAARELTARLCELRLKAKGAESDEASPGKQGAVQQAARTVANVAAFARWRGAAQLVAVYASSDTPQPHNGFFTKVLGTRDAFSVHRAVRMVVYLDLDQWFSALAFEMPPTELGGFGEQLFPVLLPVRRRWQWAMQDDHPYEHLCAGFFVARRGAFARRMLSDWWEAAEQLPRRGHWAARKVGCCTGLHPGDQGCLHHALFGHMARYNNLSYTAVCLTQGKGQAPNWMFPDSQGPVFHRGGMPVRKIKVGAQANNHVNLRKVLSRSGIRQGVSNFSWGEIYFVPPRIGPGVRAKLSHALWSTTEPLPHVLLHTGGSRARPGVGYLERIFIPPHRYDNGTGQAQLLWERELAEVARLWKEELSQPAPPKRGVRIKNPKGFLASRLGRRR